MDYKNQIKQLQQYLARLERACGQLQEAEELIMSIERQVSDLDRTLPDADKLHGTERAQVLKMYDLTEEIFRMVDNILGPPQDQDTDSPAGTAYMPEARGNGGELSLDNLLSLSKKRQIS